MIIFNPQDLTPLLAAMRGELKGDLETLATNLQSQNNALSQNVANSNQSVVDSIDALSVVNGEISTEVQAINTHTTKAVKTIQPKEKVFEFIEQVTGSVDFAQNERGTKVGLEVQGEGILKNVAQSNYNNMHTTMVEVDGKQLNNAYLSDLLSNGGVRFTESIKVTYTRTSSKYNARMTTSVFLGNFVWKS